MTSSSSFLFTASPPSTSLSAVSLLRSTTVFLYSSLIRAGLKYPLTPLQKQTNSLIRLILGNYAMTSSPHVECTARKLACEILELREGNRAFVCYAVSVRYKTIQGIVMLSTSALLIRWTVKGKPKSLLAAVSGDLIIKVKSEFTLNQISGQLIEHEESWDSSSLGLILFLPYVSSLFLDIPVLLCCF